MQDSQADPNEKLPAGIAASDMIANGPTAHRSAVSTADTATDLSSAGFGSSGTKLSDNRGAITIWAEFSTSGASATCRVVYYDNASTPAPMCVGPAFTLAATMRRVSASGDYVSEPKMVETYGFARFKVFIETLSAGTIDVFAEPI
jgi:hypothetical protein